MGQGNSKILVITGWGKLQTLVINKVGKIADSCHKYGKGFKMPATHPTQFFGGVPPPGLYPSLAQVTNVYTILTF